MKQAFFFAALFAMFFFNKPANPDTIWVETFDHSGQGCKKILRPYRILSAAEFDLISHQVKQIVNFEWGQNHDEQSMEEEKTFLDTLKDWRKRPKLHVLNALAGSRLDKPVYQDFDTLLCLAQIGDQLSLQRRLVTKFWSSHLDHEKTDLSRPIWTEGYRIAFYKKFEETPAPADPKLSDSVTVLAKELWGIK